MAGSNQTFQIIGIIIILAVVAFGIYYYMSMQGKKQQEMQQQNMMNLMKQKMMSEVADVQISEGFENKEDEEEKKDEDSDVGVAASENEHFASGQNQMMTGKQQLTAGELLPNDSSSQWAQVYPTGEGSLKDRNFLQAGYHIGINTVGQTLRNANMQLRSEPPAPQVKVSPWLQSTIEPDLGRKPFEIGGCM